MQIKDLDLNKLLSDSQMKLNQDKNIRTKDSEVELPEKEVIISNKKKKNPNYYILRINADSIQLLQHHHKKDMEYSFKDKKFLINHQECLDGAFITEFNNQISKIK